MYKAYKLTEYAGRGRRKLSESKATLPGRKQVYRTCTDDGVMEQDLITLHDEHHDGSPLLTQVMSGGQRVQQSESLDTIRERVRQQLSSLPEALRDLQKSDDYSAGVSRRLQQMADEVDRAIAERD